eukprot:scaffold304530_cov21-Tisochrysis_lutea.AAC.1
MEDGKVCAFMVDSGMRQALWMESKGSKQEAMEDGKVCAFMVDSGMQQAMCVEGKGNKLRLWKRAREQIGGCGRWQGVCPHVGLRGTEGPVGGRETGGKVDCIPLRLIACDAWKITRDAK